MIGAAGAVGTKAASEVKIDIGRLPDECYALIPYPPVILDEDARVQIKRWKLIVDRANRTHVIACVREYYENLRAGLKKGAAK